jgi:hypothetical protein
LGLNIYNLFFVVETPSSAVIEIHPPNYHQNNGSQPLKYNGFIPVPDPTSIEIRLDSAQERTGTWKKIARNNKEEKIVEKVFSDR